MTSGAGNLTDFQDIVEAQGLEAYPHCLAKNNFRAFVDHMKIGDAFLFSERSSSADGILKVSENYVMEWQSKNGTQWGSTDIQTEVNKSLSNNSDGAYHSIFVIFFANGVDEDHVLRGVITEGPPNKPNESTLRLPPNMTLVIPSSQRVQEFLGPHMSSKFAK